MKKPLLFSWMIFLLSCSVGMDIKRNIVGNYYLTAPDDDEQLGLTYQNPGDQNGGYDGIIEQTVFAVGYNKQYIIAKKHPPNKDITNYFILPYSAYKEPKNEDLIGPLTLNE